MDRLKKRIQLGREQQKILQISIELYDNCTWTQKALSIWMSNMHHWHVMFYQFRKFNIAHIPIWEMLRVATGAIDFKLKMFAIILSFQLQLLENSQ